MEMLNLKNPINQLSFGNPKENERVQNLLLKEGINTLEDLCQKTKAELQAIGKIGDVTISRIVCNLEKFGLHLGMTPLECNIYNRRKCRELLSSKSFINKIEHLLEGDVDYLRFMDRDLMPEESEDEEEFDVDDECVHHIALNIHNNLQLPKKEPAPIDWDARFYEVAKEEFLRQSRVFSCEETRAERAVYAASAFIEAMKEFQSKNKSI